MINEEILALCTQSVNTQLLSIQHKEQYWKRNEPSLAIAYITQPMDRPHEHKLLADNQYPIKLLLSICLHATINIDNNYCT